MISRSPSAMHILLMLHTNRIAEKFPPPGDEEDDDLDEEDDEDVSPEDAATLTEDERRAVLALIGEGAHIRGGHHRVETPDGPVTFFAKGLHEPGPLCHFRLTLRSLDPGPVGFLFELMRAGNLHMVPHFDQWKVVAASEEQAGPIRGRFPEVFVRPTPEDLRLHLAERVEARLATHPDAFEEGWDDLMSDAEAAARTMLRRDREAGEREFLRLLESHPADADRGSLLFVRGRAYAALGEKDRAADDLREAVRLFPEDGVVKPAIREALARVTA
jgi:hypothetical protein